MNGIIFAYAAYPELGGLVANRTTASLPFGGRYRLIDFILSSMVNAGISDVGVIVQRNYNSLLDHLGTGKNWGLDRKLGGLRIFPPFSLAGSKDCVVRGHMDALDTIRPYLERRQEKYKYTVLASGSVAINIDLKDVLDRHISSGADITAVTSEKFFPRGFNRMGFMVDEAGFATAADFQIQDTENYVGALGIYILSNELLLKAMDMCAEKNICALSEYISIAIASGLKVNTYNFKKYTGEADSIAQYFNSNMDLLELSVARDLLPDDPPVYTKERADVSTYYSDSALSHNCLIADGCFIEGTIENCILFRGVKVKKGAVLKNCIIMQDTVIEEGAQLSYVITDKEAHISQNSMLCGSPENIITIKKRESV